MARCGCTPKCNCVFLDGVCTTVDVTTVPGAGCDDPTFTYAFNVETDQQTVFCQGGQLVALLNTIDTNTIDLSGNGTAGDPLRADVILTPDGNVPNPNNIPNSTNLIKEGAPGIYVSCEDVQDCVGSAINQIAVADCLDYDDATNTITLRICAEANGLECAPPGDPLCPAGGLLVTPSADPNNALTFGTDQRLFAPATAVAPGDCMTGDGTLGNPFAPQIAPENNGVECIPGQGLAVIPSAQAGNNLVFGGDTRLFVNRCPLTLGGSQVLVGNAGPCFELVGGDCGVPMVATLRLSDDVCQGLICGNDGLFVQLDQTPLPAIVQNTINIGPFGPFNGTINGPLPGGSQGQVIDGPTCLTITNPSPCRAMNVTGILDGTAEIGRNAGEIRVRFEIDQIGGGAGPWFQVSQVGTGAPNPAGRYTGNAIWDDEVGAIPPGASRTICTRMTFRTINAVNAQIFNIQRTLTLVGRWSE